MNGVRATLAVARRDLRPASLFGLVARMAVGLILGLNDLERNWPSAVACYCVVVGTTAGLEIRVRDLTYFTAPLYGRQLARAHALTATCVAVAAPFTVLAVSLVRHAAWPWESVAATLAGSIVAALVGLSGTLRRGAAAAAYAFMALVAGFAIVLLQLARIPLYGWLALAVLLGFLALRAFGETLARYDPLE